MIRFDIFCDQQCVGHAIVEWLDPPMGVAGGNFQASAAFEPKLHAAFLGDNPNLDVLAERLSVRDSVGQTVACEGIGIRDAEHTAEIEILGIAYPAYAEYFSEHPHFKAAL